MVALEVLQRSVATITWINVEAEDAGHVAGRHADASYARAREHFAHAVRIRRSILIAVSAFFLGDRGLLSMQWENRDPLGGELHRVVEDSHAAPRRCTAKPYATLVIVGEPNRPSSSALRKSARSIRHRRLGASCQARSTPRRSLRYSRSDEAYRSPVLWRMSSSAVGVSMQLRELRGGI